MFRNIDLRDYLQSLCDTPVGGDASAEEETTVGGAIHDNREEYLEEAFKSLKTRGGYESMYDGDNTELEEYENYVGTDEYVGGDSNTEKVSGGVQISRTKNIMDIVYNNPYVRNFTKGKLKPIKTKEDIVLSMAVDSTYFGATTLSELKEALLKAEWSNFFFKKSEYVFDPSRPKSSYFNPKARPVVYTVTLKKGTKFYKEEDYDAAAPPVGFKASEAVIISIKGVDSVVTKTSNVTIKDFYKINVDNTLSKIKDLSDVGKFVPRKAPEISEILKNVINLASPLSF